MKRLLTAAVGVPLALGAVFYLPGIGFWAVCAILMSWAAWEFAALARPLAPQAPWLALPPLVFAAAAGMARLLVPPGVEAAGFWLLTGAVALAVGLGSLVLFARTPVREALVAIGLLAFAVPYFAAPVAALYRLQQHDPWVLFLLLAIVWLGDTAAYYVGSRFGRHKMAPVVSPKKSWEGAAAGFATSLGSTVVWSLWKLDVIDWRLLAVGAATTVASQVGDLVESVVKRAAGVKDSSDILPGHGGIFDRMDAMLFAAPVMLLGLWWAGFEVTAR